jgi:hypothetical protein
VQEIRGEVKGKQQNNKEDTIGQPQVACYVKKQRCCVFDLLGI